MVAVKEWIQVFLVELSQTSFLELLGVGFGVVQVLLAKKNRILLYPFGIASVLITIYIMFYAGLYAEVLLNVYYLIMSIYGWAYWGKGSQGAEKVVISYSGKKEWATTVLIVAVGFPLLYWALIRFTDSTVPIWDAWITATAWAGMWLLARRKIENWILLNISNSFAIPLLVYKGLHLYSLLTVFLFIIAVLGYQEWRKIIKTKAYKLDGR